MYLSILILYVYFEFPPPKFAMYYSLLCGVSKFNYLLILKNDGCMQSGNSKSGYGLLVYILYYIVQHGHSIVGNPYICGLPGSL